MKNILIVALICASLFANNRIDAVEKATNILVKHKETTEKNLQLVVKTNKANVRKKPFVDYKNNNIIKVLDKDSVIEVYPALLLKHWYKLKTGGFISKSTVSKIGE